MNKLKPILFALLALFSISTVIISCTNEEEAINESYSLEENTAIFAKEFIGISEEIHKSVELGDVFKNDQALDLKIKSVRTIDEFYGVLKNSNIKNNTVYISLMKKRIKLYTDFVRNNKSLQKLSKEQRSKMMLDAFRIASMNPYKNTKIMGKTVTLSCNDQFSIDVERETRDRDQAYDVAAFSAGMTSAASGGVLAPEAAIALLIALFTIDQQYDNGLDDAGADFDDCVNSNRGCANKKVKIKY